MSDFDSSLPIRTENDGDVVVKIADSLVTSQQLSITAAGEAKVDVTQPLPAGTNNIGKVSVQDSAGAAITITNPLPVIVSQNLPGTNVNKYNTTVNVASLGSTNHDYTITALKTFTGKKFWASGSGKIRMDVQTSPDGAAFTTFWTGFNSTATPNISVDLDLLSITDSGTGSKIRIIITNDDKQAFDVFTTISGVEN